MELKSNFKNAEDLILFLRLQTKTKIVNRTYFGQKNCPHCKNKVDAMMLNGSIYYFEIDYSEKPIKKTDGGQTKI